ncbi:chorismate--pyruvate lyase family protein [Formivibrio citricus]|nr:chorismate lyase [Formivibrio citricus]
MSRPHFWRHPLCLAPRALHPWLTEAGSLTARLKKSFPALRVRVLRQGWQRPVRDELCELRLQRPEAFAAVREVLLLDGDVPLVFAHSATPRQALRGGFHLLERTGSRPLGALLFADPTITRSPLAWCRVDRRHPLWRRAKLAAGPLPPRLWARRSVFFSGRDRLLVTEVFLPATNPKTV